MFNHHHRHTSGQSRLGNSTGQRTQFLQQINNRKKKREGNREGGREGKRGEERGNLQIKITLIKVFTTYRPYFNPD